MIKVTRNLNGLKRLLNKVPERVTAKVGIIDNPDVARYAVFNEYGWVQRVTGAQSLFLRGALGQPVPTVGGKPQWSSAAIKPGSTLMSPPRPFLRATARDCSADWQKQARQILEAVGPLGAEQAVLHMARQAQVDVQETIRNNGTAKEKFPDRSPLTLALYESWDGVSSKGRKRKISGDSGSKRSQALIKTGTLLGAIGYQVEKK